MNPNPAADEDAGGYDEFVIDAPEEAIVHPSEFVMRVLHLFAVHPNDLNQELSWVTDSASGPVRFYVDCSDTFAWATSDSEPLTPDNIGVFEQVLADLGTQDNCFMFASTLFAARVRGMRPMRLAYPKDSPEVCALFDACGPERDRKTEG